MTKEEILEIAKTCATRTEFQRTHPSAYNAASYRGWLEECWAILPPSVGAVQYTDDELVEFARRFNTKKAWRESSTADVESGRPSHYRQSQRRSQEHIDKCTEHMQEIPYAPRPPQYTHAEEDIKQSALKFQHRGQWRHDENGRKFYTAAKFRGEAFFEECCAHMTTAASPYSGAYIIYAYEFSDNSAYVGLSCKPEHRHHGHMRSGPVHNHMKVCPNPQYVVVQTGLPNPDAAKEAEKAWVVTYKERGYSMLNIAPTGSVGSVAIKWTPDRLIEHAQQFEHRTDWYEESQYTYQKAKDLGCFEECCAHMTRNTPTGFAHSEEAKQNMRIAALGRTNSARHNAKIKASLDEHRANNPEAYAAQMAKVAAASSKPKSATTRQRMSEGRKTMLANKAYQGVDKKVLMDVIKATQQPVDVEMLRLALQEQFSIVLTYSTVYGWVKRCGKLVMTKKIRAKQGVPIECTTTMEESSSADAELAAELAEDDCNHRHTNVGRIPTVEIRIVQVPVAPHPKQLSETWTAEVDQDLEVWPPAGTSPTASEQSSDWTPEQAESYERWHQQNVQAPFMDGSTESLPAPVMDGPGDVPVPVVGALGNPQYDMLGGRDPIEAVRDTALRHMTDHDIGLSMIPVQPIPMPTAKLMYGSFFEKSAADYANKDAELAFDLSQSIKCESVQPSHNECQMHQIKTSIEEALHQKDVEALGYKYVGTKTSRTSCGHHLQSIPKDLTFCHESVQELRTSDEPTT